MVCNTSNTEKPGLSESPGGSEEYRRSFTDYLDLTGIKHAVGVTLIAKTSAHILQGSPMALDLHVVV